MLHRWREFYGANPLHLLALLACFALAAYAALHAAESSQWPLMLLWFAGAVIAHDLVLYPLYSAADRGLARLRPQVAGDLRLVNYLRVPLLGAGLTFLLFFPGILQDGAASYRAATGLTQEPFLGRWLLLVAGLFVASGLVYAVRLATVGRYEHRKRPD